VAPTTFTFSDPESVVLNISAVFPRKNTIKYNKNKNLAIVLIKIWPMNALYKILKNSI